MPTPPRPLVSLVAGQIRHHRMRQGSIIQLGMDDPAGPAELRILGDQQVVAPAPSGVSAVAAENASAANSAANEADLLSVADWTRGRLFAEGQGRLTRS